MSVEGLPNSVREFLTLIFGKKYSQNAILMLEEIRLKSIGLREQSPLIKRMGLQNYTQKYYEIRKKLIQLGFLETVEISKTYTYVEKGQIARGRVSVLRISEDTVSKNFASLVKDWNKWRLELSRYIPSASPKKELDEET